MYRAVIIDTQFGDIDGDLICEKIILKGIQEIENSSFMNKLQLVIEKERDKKIYDINIKGYFFNLYLVNILNNNSQEILITGQYSKSRGYAITRIFKYENNKLKVIIDDKDLSSKLKCKARYLSGYKVEVKCENSNKTYTIDLNNNLDDYIDIVYDKYQNPLNEEEPTVSEPNTIYPIIVSSNNYYSLQIQQRIIGVSNSDVIGSIQSILEIKENGEINVKQQYLVLMDREPVWTKLPEGAEIISLDRFGGKNDVIILDLDNKYGEEIIFAYKYNKKAYVGIGKYNKDKFVIVDIYEGRGSDISHLFIRPILHERSNTIVIGWKVRDISSNLDLLIYEDKNLKSILNNKDLYFTMIDLIDFNNNNLQEIVLWTHDTKDAYNVRIFEYKNNYLIETNKYDEIYYIKVLKYYEDLVNKYPNSTTYLYYLANAQNILGYDSKETLKKLENLNYDYKK